MRGDREFFVVRLVWRFRRVAMKLRKYTIGPRDGAPALRRKMLRRIARRLNADVGFPK